VIGVDGGGTSTRARVWQRGADQAGQGQAGPSGLSQGVDQAWRHIQAAIDDATRTMTQPASPAHTLLSVGLAGTEHPDWVAAFRQRNPGFARLIVHSDAQTALEGAVGQGPGALIILGTGAAAQVRPPHGPARLYSAWGFPSGDEGSGADLGLQALRRTQQAVDGRRPHSPLTRAVLAHGGGTEAALRRWCSHAGQHACAQLAPYVFDHAPHDPAAQALLQSAVDTLAALVRGTGLSAEWPVCLQGSIAQRLAPLLPEDARARVKPAQGDALDGALALGWAARGDALS
jgi:glucosamine kinase